jgi:hypothetical protein
MWPYTYPDPLPVLRNREVLSRIRIRGSVTLTPGSGSCSFRQKLSRCQGKISFFALHFLLNNVRTLIRIRTNIDGSGSERPKTYGSGSTTLSATLINMLPPLCAARSELGDLGRAGQIVRSLNAPFQICPGITPPEAAATSQTHKLSFSSTDLGSLLIERYGRHLFVRHRSCRRIHLLEPQPSSSLLPRSPDVVVQCTACAACVQHPDDHVSLMAADKDDDEQKCAYAADNEEEERTEKGEQEEGEEAASITEDFGKQCCESGIRCVFDPRDPGWAKNQVMDPGMNIIPHPISESVETVFWVKIPVLKFFDMMRIRIRDPGYTYRIRSTVGKFGF